MKEKNINIKEIGGYFEFENLYKYEKYSKLLKFNTSRNALRFLIKENKIKKIYLPYYLCTVVKEACKKENIDIEFYHVDKMFMPILDNTTEYVYIVNYYGILNKEDILNLNKKYKNIIIDNTHSFFQEPIDNISTIYNCRKYFGVSDGAYLATTIKNNNQYEIDKSINRFNHLIGRYEIDAKTYYEEFKRVDKLFCNEEIKRMSKITTNIMGSIDYQEVEKIRKDNFNYLNDKLKSINELELKDNLTFMYPFKIENANVLRKILIDNNIFIPILWPDIDNNLLNNYEIDFINNILPLPIDQRYNLDDMKIIIKLILNSLNIEVK